MPLLRGPYNARPPAGAAPHSGGRRRKRAGLELLLRNPLFFLIFAVRVSQKFCRATLSYSPRELENRLSYSLGVKVLKRDGKKKWVYYKGYKTAKLATPYDMEAALKEHSIRCVMVEE